ncbi:MAG: hypothetical protein KGN80_05375 [Acidobacteriota bacterium]|nr:hypothetical protein [Acidobacteriota bacterium]
MLRKLSAWMAAGCVLLLTGCLDYGQQTLTYRYDAKRDTLRIFQVYQGIFGDDQPVGLSAKELDQLQSVLSGQRTFFFANWILEYDRAEIRKALEDPAKPEAKLDAATRKRQQQFLKLLLDNVRVENGAFYLDEQGKLCGVQRVTVTRLSSLVAAANMGIRDLLKLEAGREKVPAEERDLFLRSAERPRPFVVMEGNQLRLRIPMTQASFEKSFGPKTDSSRQIDEFKRQGGQAAFSDNELNWSFGAPSDTVTTLTLPVSEKLYVANALDAVKSRAVVHEKMDVAAAAKAFIWATDK